MADSTTPKIMIEFREFVPLLEWFDNARASGLLPRDTDLFIADDLDGRYDARTVLVRRRGDRPDRFRVRNQLGEIMTAAERAKVGPDLLDELAARD